MRCHDHIWKLENTVPVTGTWVFQNWYLDSSGFQEPGTWYPRVQVSRVFTRVPDSSMWVYLILVSSLNMRLDRTPQSNAFSQWLLEVGAELHLGPNASITLPPACASLRTQWRPSSTPSILMLLMLKANLTSISWSAPSSLQEWCCGWPQFCCSGEVSWRWVHIDQYWQSQRQPRRLSHWISQLPQCLWPSPCPPPCQTWLPLDAP